MDALILTGKGQVHIGAFPEPPMDDNTVKVAISYCGICGTDLHKFEGKSGSRPLKLPVPLGHEISGVVVEVGSKVTSFKSGDRVTVDPNWSCGKCFYCQSGLSHLCENSRGVVKGMADFICPPQENVYKLPDSLSLLDAALTEPVSCCLRGMDHLDIKLGHTVAIVGMGAIGTIMLQLCRRAGAGKILVLEAVEEKREKALAMGADLFINPMTENVQESLAAAGIRHIDRVLECVGLEATVNTAISVAGRGATVVLFGLSDPEKPMGIDHYQAMTKELQLKTSFLNPHTTHRAIALLEQGALDTAGIISAVISPEEAVEELAQRKRVRQGKVIVKWKEL